MVSINCLRARAALAKQVDAGSPRHFQRTYFPRCGLVLPTPRNLEPGTGIFYRRERDVVPRTMPRSAEIFSDRWNI